ncbi:cytochrome ubiquinol oxidase subunit II [Pseudoroseicyclus sp. H15]
MRRVLPFLMLAALLPLAGCGAVHISFLDPQGPVAAQQRGHFLLIIGVMMIIVLPVLVLTPWLAWRYAYGKHNDYRPDWHFNWGWELALWGVPFVIAGVLGVFLWQNTTTLDPYDELAMPGEPLQVQAIGYDWKWLFVYPELGIASIGELAFPADRQLAIELTSATVMQSFSIPALGSQIYAMGGMVTRLHLAADEPGRFLGRNTQYNGTDFSDQRFEAVAMSSEDFAAWVAEAQAAPPLSPEAQALVADRSAPGDLAESLGRSLPLTFSQASPDMFSTIVHEAMQ